MHDTNTVKSRTLTRRCAPPSPARGRGAAKRAVCRGDVPDDSRSSVPGETAPMNGRSPQTNRLARVAATFASCMGKSQRKSGLKPAFPYRTTVSRRSEELTSELKYLMCTSYGVLCLKHKTYKRMPVKPTTNPYNLP